MRRLVLFLLAGFLAACNAPGRGFKGIPATRVTVGGSTFDVSIAENRAEAIRVNAQYAPRIGPMHDRARLAIERVSGCNVKKVKGDQAVAIATLGCGKPPRRSKPPPRYIDCVPVRGTEIKSIDGVRVEIDCT